VGGVTNEIWHKGSLREDDARTSNTHIARACAEKVHDATLDDEKYNLCSIGAACVNTTCVVVTALCNQPEAYRFGPQ